MGAWIETLVNAVTSGISMSHPTWVRGLKPKQCYGQNHIEVSHPTWVRGLKLLIKALPIPPVRVAPHVGAWIETRPVRCDNDDVVSHPTWVRGLKHKMVSYYINLK